MLNEHEDLLLVTEADTIHVDIEDGGQRPSYTVLAEIEVRRGWDRFPPRTGQVAARYRG